jgi:putative phosphoribosyl transferase
MRWRDAGPERYRDREHAGRLLAQQVEPEGRPAVVLALPRGGVPVAAPIAERWQIPLAVLTVRKLGAPDRRELAMGAVASVGDRVELFRNESLVRQLGVDDEAFAAIRDREVKELARRVSRFGQPPELANRHLIVVDDGLATGATMVAAVRLLSGLSPATITVAVPVAARQALELVTPYARVVCPRTPQPFIAVGQAYDDFEQVSDDEVRRLLQVD